jgi:hypothetical protein
MVEEEKKKIPRIFIQVTLSESDKKKIMDIAEECHKTASEFMRDATFDKIKRIKNPELSNSVSVQTLSPEIIAQIISKQNETIELQKLLLEKSQLMDDMNKTLEFIQEHSNLGLKSEKDEIINLLKAHKTMNIKQIIENTGFEKDVVFQIVSDTKTFKLENGRFSLNV